MNNDYPEKTAHVEISSFRGISFGAEHYYAKFITGYDDGDINEKLKRKLDLKEAKKLDIKDQTGGVWEDHVLDGDGLTERFNTKEEIYQAAIKVAEEHNIDLVVVGERSSIEAKRIIVAPERISEESVKALNTLADAISTINTNIYFHK